MLSDVLKKEYIKLNVECNDWEEAIRVTGQILINNEVVTNEYIENTINGIKELGPYVVIAKGISLPHTTSSAGVNKTGISLVRLKNAVEFGSVDNDPVRYIFMLATTDMESHINALTSLSEFLEKEEFLKVIENSSDSQSIIDYIKYNENLIYKE